MTLCEAVCDKRFWLLGLGKFCGMGCGLMLLNNIPQVRYIIHPHVILT